MYHNEPLIKIFTEDRAEYIDALNLTEEKEDISIFRNFICHLFYTAKNKLNSLMVIKVLIKDIIIDYKSYVISV